MNAKRVAANKRKGTQGRSRLPPKPEGPDADLCDIDGEQEVMTLREVANYLNCHYATAYGLARTGKLRCFKLGSDYRFRRSDLKEWIANSTVNAIETKPAPRKRKLRD